MLDVVDGFSWLLKPRFCERVNQVNLAHKNI